MLESRDIHGDHEISQLHLWLGDSVALQCEDPAIRVASKRLTQLRASIPDKAQACFRFVQTIKFRWPSSDEAASAPAVMRRGFGDSFTKGTLLVSLLRTCEIPARLRVTPLPAALFRGLLQGNATAVRHAYVEAYVGRWQGIDAHVLDTDLALAAKLRLLAERQPSGYGLYAIGARAWEGNGDAFSQVVRRANCATDEDWGPFNDGAEALAVLRHSGGAYDRGAFARVSRRLANWRAAGLRRNALDFRQLQKNSQE